MIQPPFPFGERSTATLQSQTLLVVRLPERFRTGCAFGGGWQPVQSNRTLLVTALSHSNCVFEARTIARLTIETKSKFPAAMKQVYLCC